MLSVVIPTFDSAQEIGETMKALLCPEAQNLIGEIIIVDGGSADITRDIARDAGAKVVIAKRGRGGQLATGAKSATGEHLLFLHGDTRLGIGWVEAIKNFIADRRNAEQVAVFRFRLDDNCAAAWRLARAVAWRTEYLGLPYGDQALLLSSALYHRLGGYASIPIMEDVDLIRRIGRRQIVVLDADAITSAKRYRREGYLFRSIRNLTLLALYFAGVSPHHLARHYDSKLRFRQRK